jgi:hypothetical protein
MGDSLSRGSPSVGDHPEANAEERVGSSHVNVFSLSCQWNTSNSQCSAFPLVNSVEGRLRASLTQVPTSPSHDWTATDFEIMEFYSCTCGHSPIFFSKTGSTLWGGWRKVGSPAGSCLLEGTWAKDFGLFPTLPFTHGTAT